MKRFLLAVALVIATGCLDQFFGPQYGPPKGTYAFTPPDSYTTWWAQVEGCSHHARNMDEINWLAVPGGNLFEYKGSTMSATYVEPRTVMIAEDYRLVGPVVRRMMFHAMHGDTLSLCKGVIYLNFGEG